MNNSDGNIPLVSVLMTAYNREKYIAEAIESVLASTYTHFELIIVDDRSADQTVSIAKEYETRDQRIKVYVNEENLGQFPNRNKAATYARGKYIKYLDSDDRLYDFSLDYCVNMMEKNPELFKTIAGEIQEKVKAGKDQQSASMEVMKKYESELKKLA